MKDLITKAISLGLGLAVASKEQVEKAVEELVKKGEVARADSSTFTEELIRKGEEARRQIDETVRSRVSAVVSEKRYATKADIERLERRLDALERNDEPDL